MKPLFALTIFASLPIAEALALPDYVTSEVVVYRLGNAATPVLADEFDVPAPWSPYNIAETYEIDGRYFLLLISGGSGTAVIIELNADGTHAATIQGTNVGASGWRAAQVTRVDNTSRLYLFDSREGVMTSYVVRANTGIDLGTMVSARHDDLENKNLFSAFAQSGRRVFALDSFSGSATVRGLDPTGAVTTANYSQGWTDLDHLQHNGTIYRLLYKEVGHPFRPPSENGAEAGRVEVLQLGANGLGASTPYSGNWNAGLTSVRFLRISSQWNGIARYRRSDGTLKVNRFSGLAPSATTTLITDTNIGTGFDTILPYRNASQALVVGVRFDPNTAEEAELSGDAAARIAQCVHDNLEGRAVGYQLAALQTGEEVLNRAYGHSLLSPAPVPMNLDTRLNMGSVGKMMTTISTMRMAEMPEYDVDLDEPISTMLSPVEYPPAAMDPWFFARTPRELMAQSTGWARNPGEPFSCEPQGVLLTVDCTPFFSNPPTNSCGPVVAGRFRCPRSYYNAHFGALRQIMEEASGNSDANTIQIDALTRELWLDSVLEGPTCEIHPDSEGFAVCQGESTCVAHGGQTWNQRVPIEWWGWNESCGAGGWHASAQDMVEIMEALRAGAVLSEDHTRELFDINWMAQNGQTAMGWEEPYVARPGSGMEVLGKNGGTGSPGWSSYITNWEGFGQGALFINTTGGAPDADSLLRMAYRYGVDPSGSDCNRMITYAARDTENVGDADSVAIASVTNNTFVTALRDGGDDLRLITWRRSQGTFSRDETYVGPEASMIRVLQIGTASFVVAFRDASNELRIHHYGIDLLNGTIQQRDTANLGPVSAIALVKVGLASAEFAVVVKNGNSKLMVIAYDIGANGTLTRKGEYTSTTNIEGVAAADSSVNGRFTAAFETSTGELRLNVFEVSANGMTVTRLGQTSAPDVIGSDVRLVRAVSSGNSYFVTATHQQNGSLRLITWNVSNGGATIARRADVTKSGSVIQIGHSLRRGLGNWVFVPIVDSDNDAKVLAYELSADGMSLRNDATATQGIDANRLDILVEDPYVTAAVVDDNGDLQLTNFEALVPSF